MLFLWSALMPAVIPNTLEGQAVSKPVIESSNANIWDKQINIRYFDDEDNCNKTLELEEYVARALTVLMNDDAPIEAQKAQAVAIRSVICHRHEHPEHQGFELCGDGEHCFKLAEKAHNSAIEATKATKGETLTYKGKAALALSHSSSCVKTESYETVYGKNLEYLTTTKVYDESSFYDYKMIYNVDKNAFCKAFVSYNVIFSENTDDWIGKKEFTSGNRVYTIEVGGLCFKGTTFAKLLNLQSTCFDIENTHSGFKISCYGIGNGIGMSRYTAILMAEEGKKYKDILNYFYQNTLISQIQCE